MPDFEVNFDVETPKIEAEFDLAPLTVDAEFTIEAGAASSVLGSELIDAIVDPSGNTVTIKSKTYVHEQEEASDTWVINHNLGKRPSVTVVDTAEEEQIPDRKVYDNDNTVTLYFLAGFKGKAFLN